MVEQSVWFPFPSQAPSTGGCSQWSLSSLSLPAQLETVLPEPGSPPRASLSLVELVSLTKPTRLLASSSQAPELPVLLDGSAHPVDLGISPDSRVVGVDHDDLKVLVGGVLSDPVGVEDPETLEPPPDSLLSDGLKVPLRLLLLHSTRSLWLTIGTALSDRPLPSSPPHGDPVDDESLLGLVAQPAGFVRSRGPWGTVHLGDLAILPTPDPEQVAHHIALLLPVEFGDVLVGAHDDHLPTSLVEVNQAIKAW